MSCLSSRDHLPQLDGIRGLAILLVLVYHWLVLPGIQLLPEQIKRVGGFGWAGVDLFFVLSGFLIGGILIEAKDSTNYFSVFYTRRAFRILPIYLAVCLLSALMYYAPLSTHSWLFEEKVPWYAYLTMGQNFWMAKYNAFQSHQIDATWSLAIEEQFYLTLPLIVRLVLLKRLPIVLIVGILTAPLFRLFFWYADPSSRVVATYVLTPCRMDALLLGVLAAWVVRQEPLWTWLKKHSRILSLITLLVGAGVWVFVFNGWNFGSFELTIVGYTWLALFNVLILLLAITNRRGPLSVIFQFRPLRFLGSISYCVYLLHQPMAGLVYGLAGRPAPVLSRTSDLVMSTMVVMLTMIIASVSKIYFEQPLIDIGRRFKYAHRLKSRQSYREVVIET